MSRSNAAAEELTVIAARVERRLRLVRGRATSDDGTLHIEVGVDGRITDLVLSEHLPHASKSLSSSIARTHAAALDDATRAAQDIRRELLNDPRVGRLVDHVATQPDPAVDHDDEPVQPSSIYERW